jgi:asparagine synthase (glutamine-hydrolysing)
VPKPLRKALSKTALAVALRSGRFLGHAQAIEEAAEGRLPFWGGAIAYQGALKDLVLSNGRPHPDSYAIVQRFLEQAERERPDADLLQKMTYLELKNRLAELLLMRVDKMTMANSVEARVPFLDHELVEFALALPAEMKVRNGEGKYLLKKAVEGILPPEVINRPKQGFVAPVGDWLRGETGAKIRREIKNSTLAQRGLLDYEAIDRLWDAHQSGRGEWSFQLWNIYNVSAWHDLWIAGRTLA